jgi:hypothetical protein
MLRDDQLPGAAMHHVQQTATLILGVHIVQFARRRNRLQDFGQMALLRIGKHDFLTPLTGERLVRATGLHHYRSKKVINL